MMIRQVRFIGLFLLLQTAASSKEACKGENCKDETDEMTLIQTHSAHTRRAAPEQQNSLDIVEKDSNGCFAGCIPVEQCPGNCQPGNGLSADGGANGYYPIAGWTGDPNSSLAPVAFSGDGDGDGVAPADVSWVPVPAAAPAADAAPPVVWVPVPASAPPTGGPVIWIPANSSGAAAPAVPMEKALVVPTPGADSIQVSTNTPATAPAAPPVVYTPEHDGCMPQCQWKCQSAKCDETCTPVCKAPECHTVCSASFDPSTCQMECQKPHCAVVCPKKICARADCPKCQASCTKPICKMQCSNSTNPCKNVCKVPDCHFKCQAPTDCPKPTCQMVCEQPPTCMNGCPSGGCNASTPTAPAAAGAGSLLEVGQVAVKAFEAPENLAASLAEVRHDGKVAALRVPVSRLRADNSVEITHVEVPVAQVLNNEPSSI